MTARRIAMLALFAAVALIIHTVEALIPLPIPVPGVKLGLANVVTLFMLFTPQPAFKTSDVYAVLLCRVVLAALIVGRPVMIAYSLAGGLLAVTAQVAVKRFVSDRQIWVCGAIGAVFHNIGQILAAIAITATPAVAAYLPILVIAGVATGVMTGLITQLAVIRLK